MDLYDRYSINCVLGGHNNKSLVNETFDKAIEEYQNAHLLSHSDAGFQYMSPAFIRKIKNQGIIQSMSRIGKCIDNAPMEGFWRILKSEIYNGKHYKTKANLYKSLING